MKRWICLFLLLAVCVSALSLGVHAENIDGPMFMYLSIGPSSDNLTVPNDRYVYNRVFGEIGNYTYGKIDALRINTPANYYFFFSFDISATDLWGVNTSVTNTILDSSNVSGLENISYDTSKFQIFWSTVKRVRFVDGGIGIHFEMYGVNNSDNQEQIYINYINDVLFHTESYNSSSGTRYFNNQIINFQVHFQPNIEDLKDLIDSYYDDWSNTYFPTINTFYSEFSKYWWPLVRGYVYGAGGLTYLSFNLSYDSSGVASWTSGTQYMPFFLSQSLRSIVLHLKHQTDLENKAAQSGGNDAYDDLNESANFGSLTDFAGAGSSASWSASSFVDGLGQTWNWFTQENKQLIDAVEPSRNNVYISIYDDTLEEYYRLLGGD